MRFLYQSTNLSLYIANLVKNNNDLGKLLEYNVYGSNWGLGCNILHDISVIDCILDIDKFIIDKLIWKLKSFEESKRRGYLEVYGDLKFNLNNLKVEISCIKNSKLKKKIFMKFENGFIKLNFFDEIIEITNKKGHVTRHEIEIPKASKTTGDIISKISNGKSPIPLAKKFIKISQILYNEISKNINHKFTQKLDFPFS